MALSDLDQEKLFPEALAGDKELERLLAPDLRLENRLLFFANYQPSEFHAGGRLLRAVAPFEGCGPVPPPAPDHGRGPANGRRAVRSRYRGADHAAYEQGEIHFPPAHLVVGWGPLRTAF